MFPAATASPWGNVAQDLGSRQRVTAVVRPPRQPAGRGPLPLLGEASCVPLGPRHGQDSGPGQRAAPSPDGTLPMASPSGAQEAPHHLSVPSAGNTWHLWHLCTPSFYHTCVRCLCKFHIDATHGDKVPGFRGQSLGGQPRRNSVAGREEFRATLTAAQRRGAP